MSAYDRDFYGWANTQADALRRCSANEIDWENVAEEMESLGEQQVGELRSRWEVLLAHLLERAWQPDRQGRSWLNTIREQRRCIADHLEENASLRSVQASIFEKADRDARFSAPREIAGEPDPDMFPFEPPFTAEQSLEDGWLPGPAVPASAPVTAATPAG